jgi:hypothetical protein
MAKTIYILADGQFEGATKVRRRKQSEEEPANEEDMNE